MANAHRKRVKHYDLAGHCHALTFSCYQRRPLLTIPGAYEELSISVDRALLRHDWRLAAFAFMPDHVHLLVFPGEAPSNVSNLLFAVKRPFSYRMKKLLELDDHGQLDELTIRQRAGTTTFRFWQEGPGYDRNVTSESGLLEAIDYFHRNPVRRGLCSMAEDWIWSSSRWYLSDGLEIDRRLPTLTRLPAGFFHLGATGSVEM